MADFAFVDVDTQYDFMNPEGALYVQGAAGIVSNLSKLLDAAQRHGIPVIGSVDAHTMDDPEFEQFPPHCVKGTPGQNKIPETTLDGMKIIPMDTSPDKVDLSPPGPVILEKRVYSLFDNPHANAAVEATGSKRFVVFGVATDYCVGAAARGLLEKGFDVLLVTDAIRAVDPEGGDKTLRELEAKGVRLVTTDEAVAEAGG